MAVLMAPPPNCGTPAAGRAAPAVPVQSRPPANFRSVGPLHMSLILATRLFVSTLGSITVVAPTCRATARRVAIGSTAIICDAPLIRAPCTALRPSGPQPRTTTSDAGSTGATPNVVPNPQAPTHPSIDSSTGDTLLVNTGMQYHSYGIISSPNPPSLFHWSTSVPSERVPIGSRGLFWPG